MKGDKHARVKVLNLLETALSVIGISSSLCFALLIFIFPN